MRNLRDRKPRVMSRISITSEIDPVYIISLGELVEVVTDMSANGQVVWYRGHASQSWDVLPSIWRGYSSAEERNFTNRFRSRAAIRYSPSPPYDAAASWLSLMQHYGLPTRLLDWTRSPLVAAYFALDHSSRGRDTSRDGDVVIWTLLPHVLNVRNGFDPVTPSIEAHMCESMLVPAFTDRDRENDRVMAAMASETDLRMFVQQGCFTIHSSQGALNREQGHSEFLRPIAIKAAQVPRVALEIAACGFRQGDIYPDLGNLADELKHTYLPGSFA